MMPVLAGTEAACTGNIATVNTAANISEVIDFIIFPLT